MTPKPSRSFSRGLAVLAALNRHGGATPLLLARETGVPRATVYRLLQTLLDEGYVGRGAGDDRFQLRLKVRSLSEGFEDEQWITTIAGPALEDLTRRIAWPSDIATLEGLRLVIRDSTHRVAPLSIDRNMIRRSLPLLGSSAGLAYLAFIAPGERETLLSLLARSEEPAEVPARDPASVERMLAATRRRGYGLRQGGPIWPHTGSIAVPIMAFGRVLGYINVIWMARVISHQEGVARCLEPLRETKAVIEARLEAGG